MDHPELFPDPPAHGTLESQRSGAGACSEFCGDLADVPPLPRMFMSEPVYLILPPYNWDLIAKAYECAAWRWSMDNDDRKEFWRDRKKTESIADYLLEMDHNVIPSAARVQRDIESLFADMRHRPSDGMTQSGGCMVFVSKTGKLGLFLDAVLGEHYKRLKDAQNA